ncbi:MAG: hypothetical protein SGJ17_06580 [Hyphomicrobiales bacterium]|nr:hypothetical protein [Hyphomicrobiales bacterium]
MIFYKQLLPVACLAAVAMFAANSPANAAIQCDGNFQIVRGQGKISTPYCADANVAFVAQEYGMKVSAQAVRQNPSVKERACRLVGDDIRVRDACIGYRPDGGRNRF